MVGLVYFDFEQLLSFSHDINIFGESSWTETEPEPEPNPNSDFFKITEPEPEPEP